MARGDIDLPNESGKSDLYELPDVKSDPKVNRGNPVRSRGLNGAVALEVTPKGSTMRGAPYQMQNGKKQVVRTPLKRTLTGAR